MFLSSFFFITIAYFISSPVSLQFFLNGLTLYASDFSMTHLFKQVVDLLLHYWWLISVSMLLLGCMIFDKRYRDVIFWLAIWFITIAVSVKLFGNDAAHYNNYIFFTLTFYFMVTSLWLSFKFKKIAYSILFLGLVTSFFSVNQKFSNLEIQSIHKNYQSKIYG